ncbi:MAG: hypothetical protein KF832_28985 [Caldilineaceae bacterium]|nr:hypothetical protein [Caldilineaceae bacterium]
MQSTSFRLVFAVVPWLLLAGLIAVVFFVLQTASPTPAARVRLTPTASLVAATSTTVATVPTKQERVEAGGFSFTPLPDYDLDLTATAATLTNEAGAIFLVRGGPPEQLVSTQRADLDTMFDEFVAFYASRDNFQSRNKQTTTIAGANGRVVELVSQSTSNPFRGRIVMAQPEPAQLFLLVAVSPAAEWESSARAAFVELLSSLTFFPLPPSTVPTAAFRLPTSAPTATPGAVLRPTATGKATMTRTPLRTVATATATAAAISPLVTRASQPTNAWRTYSNGNEVNDLLLLNTTIWAATEGGVSSWNRSNNVYTKFTTLDGLTVNRTTTVVDCPLPGFGLVFGSDHGLQIYVQSTGTWKTLNRTNSEMHFDDVTALYCNAEAGFLVVGYAQHGLDIYDVQQGWTLLDQRRGLPQDRVNAVTVFGDREEIWVASDTGITILRDERVETYDSSNTPLDASPIHLLVAEPQGIVWVGAGNKVYRIDGDKWTIYSATYVLASAFPAGQISAFALVGDGTLWLASDQGELCLFDPTAVTCQRFFAPAEPSPAHGITALSLDLRGRLYVATARNGLRFYDGDEWTDTQAPTELIPSNRVHAFAQAATGLLWLATDRGLYQIDPVTEQILQHFTNEDTVYPVAEIVALWPLPDGSLWVGGKGAAYLADGQWQIYTQKDGLISDQIQAIAGDAQERIWFGTNAGLSIWNGESFFSLTRADRLPSDNILALQADGDTMWIGSTAGLLRFAGNQFQLYTMATTALADNRITALAQMADGALLIGTQAGLSRQVGNEIQLVDETDTHVISAIGVSATDTIWLGTDGQGLLYFDGAAWTDPPAAVNPPDPALRSLVVDRQGSVWIAGATGGVLRYRP